MYKYGYSRWLKMHLQEEMKIFIRVVLATVLFMLVLTCTKIEHNLQDYLFGKDSSSSANVNHKCYVEPYKTKKRATKKKCKTAKRVGKLSTPR